MVSRTQVAHYIADELAKNPNAVDRSKIIERATSWLKVHGQTKSIERLVQDIAAALAETGYMFATVTTARAVNATQKQQIESFIKSTFGVQSVEAVYAVDTALIGGIKIETPKGTLDDSVQRKLHRIVENIG